MWMRWPCCAATQSITSQTASATCSTRARMHRNSCNLHAIFDLMATCAACRQARHTQNGGRPGTRRMRWAPATRHSAPAGPGGKQQQQQQQQQDREASTRATRSAECARHETGEGRGAGAEGGGNLSRDVSRARTLVHREVPIVCSLGAHMRDTPRKPIAPASAARGARTGCGRGQLI